MRVLHNRLDDFDERDAFLHMCLGLLAISRRVDSLFARRGSGVPIDDEHPVLLFALGLLACKRRVTAHMEAAVADGAARFPAQDAPPPHPTPGLRNLLR